MAYNIPLFNLNFDEEEKNNVIKTLDSKWISSGPQCAELEKRFAEMLDVKYALAVTNCTAALHLSMICNEIGPGDEVILPSMTFVATANAVRYVGATPVFCDIKGYDEIVIDENKIESLITEKTKAIVPMHYGGFPCNMDVIMNLAKKYNLKVIEDACHGPLSRYHGRCLGTIGDTGCFSFFSNKNLSTGEGGMLVTNNEEIYNRAKILRSHGMTTMTYERSKGHNSGYDVLDLGYNYRLDDIRASIGLAQLDKLKCDIDKRIEVRKLYLDELADEDDIILPFSDYKEYSSSYIFPIVLKCDSREKRESFRSYLSENGIQTSVHYPCIHRFKIYADFATADLKNTEYIADNEVTLPMYGALKKEEVVYICDTVKKGIGKL